LFGPWDQSTVTGMATKRRKKSSTKKRKTAKRKSKLPKGVKRSSRTGRFTKKR